MGPNSNWDVLHVKILRIGFGKRRRLSRAISSGKNCPRKAPLLLR